MAAVWPLLAGADMVRVRVVVAPGLTLVGLREMDSNGTGGWVIAIFVTKTP
jgi:hypothetical protein